MICTPIIIDGPARGKSITVRGYQFVVSKTPSLSSILTQKDMDPYAPIPLNETVYHVHRFKIGDLSFALASVKFQRPSGEVAFKKIFTAAAQRAVIRE